MKKDKNIDGWARGCIKVPWGTYTVPHRIGKVAEGDAHYSLLKLMMFNAKETAL